MYKKLAVLLAILPVFVFPAVGVAKWQPRIDYSLVHHQYLYAACAQDGYQMIGHIVTISVYVYGSPDRLYFRGTASDALLHYAVGKVTANRWGYSKTIKSSGSCYGKGSKEWSAIRSQLHQSFYNRRGRAYFDLIRNGHHYRVVPLSDIIYSYALVPALV